MTTTFATTPDSLATATQLHTLETGQLPAHTNNTKQAAHSVADSPQVCPIHGRGAEMTATISDPSQVESAQSAAIPETEPIAARLRHPFFQRCLGNMQRFHEDDAGMTTIEYAMGALAAAALAGALYLVVSSGAVSNALESLITNALQSGPGK